MANKNVKINVDLDITAKKTSVEEIKKQIELAVSALEMNIDDNSLKKMKKDLQAIGKIAEESFNKSTQQINLKKMGSMINARDDLASIDTIDKSLRQVGVNGTKSFSDIKNAGSFLNKSLTESNSILAKMGTTLTNTIRWNISASAVNAVTGEFQKMYYFAKDLDRSLTDIRIVSGASASEMERFAIAANKSAQELKVSTIDYANASLVFFQQGLNAIEAQNMARASIIGGNITGESTEEMSNLLTSVMNGYKIATEDVLQVTDKLAAVGASTAADFYELATAMSKVASMANAAGVPIDELNAQIATIVSVTKESPESIGTSLKTIYGRMLAFKADTKALMTDEDGETFGAPNVEAALQAYNRATGAQISLFKTTKDGKQELRDLGEVINEIGGSWDKTTDRVAKFGLATALAGSRQQNRLVSLFDSWDLYQETVEESLNAEGTSLKQNELYLESYEGKLKGLQAAKEELYMVLTDSDSMKGFISMLTKGVELVSSLAEATGGFSAMIGILGASMSKTFATKFQGVGGLSGLTAGKGTDATTDAEIDAKNKLLTINKMLGAEEANRLRDNLKGAQDSQKAHQTMFDLMTKEAELIQEIARLEESKLTAASKEDRYGEMDGESKRLMEESTNLIALKAAYADLANAKLEGESLMQRAAAETGEVELAVLDKSFDEVTTRIDDAQARIDNIKAQVPDIEEKAQEHGRKAGFEKQRVVVASDKLNKQFEESQKILKTQRAIQTTMMLLPSVISAATDETKSLEDVAQAGLKMLVPMIPAIVGGVMELPGAFKNAAEGASAFSTVMGTPLGPILAIGAGVILIGLALKKINDSTVTFAKSMKELEKASEELEEQERAYEAIEKQLQEIRNRKKEIALINKEDSTTDEEKEKLQEELDLLDIKYGKLQEEQIIEEMLLQVAREKAELAAQEAMKATMKSEYATTTGLNLKQVKDDVTVTEELEYATKAFVEAEKNVTDYRKSLADLKLDEKATAKQIEEAEKKLDNATKARDKATDNIAKHSSAIRNIIKDLGDEEGANKESIKALQEYLDASAKTIANTLGIGAAFEKAAPEEFIDDMYEIINQMEELAEAYGEAADAVETYGSFLDDLNSEEGLSIANRDKIIQKHQELIPYLGDEAAMRDFLIEKIEEEEEAQMVAYINMLMDSEDFYNAKLKGNVDLQDELRRLYDIELSDFTSLAEAKGAVDQALIKALGESWAQYYDTQTQSFSVTEEQWSNMSEQQKIQYRQLQADSLNAKKHFEGIAFELAPIKLDRVGQSERAAAEKRASKASKQAKEDKLAEADAYAEVNFEIEKQNVLLAQNKVDQDLARDNVEEKVSLMKEEIEIVKEQQKNYKELARIQLAQMKSLEEQLAKEGFKFEGEGAQRVIKDLGHIEGKTEDVKKVFDEYIKLQNSELPKTNNEWKKFGLTITNIEESINSFYKKELDDRISQSKNWIEHRMYYDDWGADNEISAWGRVRDYTQEYYDKGLISHRDYIDKMMEIDKNLEASQKRLWDTLKEAIETEKATKLMTIEEDFRKQRDRMAELRSDMEREVARIQGMADEEQSDIDEIQKSEAERKENEQRKSYLEDISKLQNKYYHLQYTGLENLTEAQAELVGLEKERADQIERQNKLQEDQIKLDNLRREKNIRQLVKGADGSWDFEYVADQKAIEDLNKKIADDQEKHEKSMDDLKKDTLKSLKKRQEEFDEWERQNRIQKTIDEKQARIKRYQDEITHLQESQREREEALEKQYAEEKAALDNQYKDIDEMTTLAMETLYNNYDGNWDKVTEMIKGYFKTITDEYRELKRELEGDIRMPNIFGAGGESDSSGSGDVGSDSSGVNLGKGSATGQAAKDNEAKLNSDPSFVKSEIQRTQEVIDNRKSVGMDTGSQERYLDRLIKGSYDQGGKITETGTFLANFHGKKNDPEWIFNDIQLQKVLKSAVLSTVHSVIPTTPNIALAGSSGGSISQSISIDKLVFPNVKDAKEIEGAIKSLSTYANQWANRQ